MCPSLLSPEFSGSGSQRAERESELAANAAKLGHSLAVGDAPTTAKPKGPAQAAFDTELSEGSAIFQEMSDKAISEYKQYLLKNGVPEAKIDRALRLDGLKIPDALPDPDLAELHENVGIPLQPRPEDYAPDFDRLALELPPARLANLKAVSSQWATDLRLDPLLGKSIVEFLASTSQEIAKMSGEQIAQWKQRQESALVKQAGSKAAAAELIARAEKVMNMSSAINGPLGSENLSASIKASPVFQSAWFLTTLANHADALAALERAKKKM